MGMVIWVRHCIYCQHCRIHRNASHWRDRQEQRCLSSLAFVPIGIQHNIIAFCMTLISMLRYHSMMTKVVHMNESQEMYPFSKLSEGSPGGVLMGSVFLPEQLLAAVCMGGPQRAVPLAMQQRVLQFLPAHLDMPFHLCRAPSPL